MHFGLKCIIMKRDKQFDIKVKALIFIITQLNNIRVETSVI